ncbi:eCIS core domain-containing protein [Halopiger djelfimassiliensis]|uniref:eCIS core domain-containing protein n=1 Tax=Halopiger djelfimassiliensis TaxID=1293047 RepID=UPI0012B53ADB|nr:DUF4157 domain-containing protein [Halopiger djelfimassiliensis]
MAGTVPRCPRSGSDRRHRAGAPSAPRYSLPAVGASCGLNCRLTSSVRPCSESRGLAIDANAVTRGDDTAFNAGADDPDRPEGQRLSAHESGHGTRQDSSAPVRRLERKCPSRPISVCG